jgi:hypothetical protein
MRLSEWFLSDAGWMFCVAWSIAIAAVSVAAFGSDLLPFKAHDVPESQPELRHPVSMK